MARIGHQLHVTGESGTGKEIVARAFHAAGPFPKGPFVAVNCATIPRSLAERLLFGARRGAFSGADSDSTGFLHAAHRGTLFLDEIGELDIAIQAKLLRVMESREVTPLGAAQPQANRHPRPRNGGAVGFVTSTYARSPGPRMPPASTPRSMARGNGVLLRTRA